MDILVFATPSICFAEIKYKIQFVSYNFRLKNFFITICYLHPLIYSNHKNENWKTTST